MRSIRLIAASGVNLAVALSAGAIPVAARAQDSGQAERIESAQDAASEDNGHDSAPAKLPVGQNLIEFVTRLKPAVLTLVVSDEDGVDVASGTAFFVDDRLVVSNHQVAAQGVKGRITLPNGQAVNVAHVVGEMREVNLVLLEVAATEHTDVSAIEPLALASAPASVDDEILMLSSAVDREHAVSKGRILNNAIVGDAGQVLRSDLSYVPGSTGSPIFNGKAEVIGVAGFTSVDGKQEKFIVASDRVMAMRINAGGGAKLTLEEYRTKYGRPAEAEANAEDAKLEATIVKQEDGSLLIDDKYVVRGAGTEADPYQITWDLLYSAARVFKPREGKDKLPERITFLHDKWVELTGYVAFPLMIDSSAEVLLMLNQWDGCCIGVPPTPYDAVEVTLIDEVKVEGGLNVFNYGTIRGHMKVDPYVVNKWLVGLYLMEKATLSLDMK